MSRPPGEIEPQIALWKAVAALKTWYVINRGTADAPRPYALAAEAGATLCVFSSAARAKESAEANGLIAPGAPLPLFSVPLPAALDWAMSLGEHGVIGVTIDYPKLGAWIPLPNLRMLRPSAAVEEDRMWTRRGPIAEVQQMASGVRSITTDRTGSPNHVDPHASP